MQLSIYLFTFPFISYSLNHPSLLLALLDTNGSPLLQKVLIKVRAVTSGQLKEDGGWGVEKWGLDATVHLPLAQSVPFSFFSSPPFSSLPPRRKQFPWIWLNGQGCVPNMQQWIDTQPKSASWCPGPILCILREFSHTHTPTPHTPRLPHTDTESGVISQSPENLSPNGQIGTFVVATFQQARWEMLLRQRRLTTATAVYETSKWTARKRKHLPEVFGITAFYHQRRPPFFLWFPEKLRLLCLSCYRIYECMLLGTQNSLLCFPRSGSSLKKKKRHPPTHLEEQQRSQHLTRATDAKKPASQHRRPE